MRAISKIVLIGVLQGLIGATCVEAAQPHAAIISAEKQQEMSPQQVLQRLKDGNKRFTSGKMKNRALLTQAHLSASRQHPVAVILSCMDARTPPEVIFDQGIGDVFAIRNAGNIQNDDVLGGMEFGTELTGAKLIVVMGHTSCGAIRGACQDVKLGNLTGLLDKIKPAIKQARAERESSDCSDAAFIDEAAKENVMLVMKQIQENSPVIDKLVKANKIAIVGGFQNLATGEVVFLDSENIKSTT